MDFLDKICVNRPFTATQYTKNKVRKKYIDNVLYQLESDRGRIINSAAIRRLQQKAQVFPLEKNSAVRSRLTHSLEVQQTGRYIVHTIFKKLSDQQLIEFGLNELERIVETIVEMSCLMHDIGNPPFGHFGEFAINDWFSCHVEKFFQDNDINDIELYKQFICELKGFEGNAQAIRIVTNLISLNITYVQLASLIKYIKPAFSVDTADEDVSNLYKKNGFFWSEKEVILKLTDSINLSNITEQNTDSFEDNFPKRRHPFVYIMEAADDISYCLADIEDAVEKGIITIEQFRNLIEDAIGSEIIIDVDESHHWNNKTISEVLEYIIEGHCYKHMDKCGSFFIQFRSGLVHLLTNYAADQFIKHVENIFDGCLNRGLMDKGKDEDGSSLACKIIEVLKSITNKYVFNDREVRALELKGYKIITGLLDVYLPVLNAKFEDFDAIVKDIVEDNGKKLDVKNKLLIHLTHRLAKKHIWAYSRSIQNIKDKENFKIIELYYRCRLIQDYISGMTDQYAFDEYRELVAII